MSNRQNHYFKNNVRILIFIIFFIFLGEDQGRENPNRFLQSNTTKQGNQTSGNTN